MEEILRVRPGDLMPGDLLGGAEPGDGDDLPPHYVTAIGRGRVYRVRTADGALHRIPAGKFVEVRRGWE
jgi:hypothetical protein